MVSEKNVNSLSRSFLPVLILLIVLEIIFFFFYGLSRHFNYLTSINDLGHMDQAVWGTLHDDLFLNSDLFSKPINRLGFHFTPILAVFLPLYALSPSVTWLILAQAVAIPLTALPTYFLARRVCQSEQESFFWATACLFSPYMLSAASWDFHTVSLAAPFIALAFLAVEKKQHVVLLVACLVVLLCSEHFGVLVIGFGMLWYIRHREFRPSLLLIMIGAISFLLIMKIIMPAFSPTGQHLMLSKDLGQLSRYAWLGQSLQEVTLTILSNPFGVLREVLFNMGGLTYLVLLFLPFLCLPLIGVEFLLPGLADLLANLLSATPMPRSLFAYHSVTLIPVCVVSAIYGCRRAGRIQTTVSSKRLSFAILIITLVIAWAAFPFFSLPGSQGFWQPKRVFALHDPNYAQVRGLISPTMSLSVQANVGAHFTQRKEVYLYPDRVGEAEAVVLRLESPTTMIGGRDPAQIVSLAHHLQMDPFAYLESAKDLLRRQEYSRVVWADPWLVFLKGESLPVDIDAVFARIDYLQHEWLSSDTGFISD
jgi:uncharacterized membrane protein